MTAEMVTVQVPQPLYERLTRLASLMRRPVECVIAQTLATGVPPLPDDLPTEQREALLALEGLDDAQLWQVERARLPEDEYRQLADLRDRRHADDLDAAERATLDRLDAAADLLTLRKAFAAVLLKWRGHRLPSLAELEAS